MKIIKFGLASFITLATAFLSVPAYALQRFPPPDFTTYKLPTTTTPAVRAEIFSYIDIGVLLIALVLASYFVLWKRSRRGIAGLSIFSLAYFGFYRHGCVCSIGAIQNIALSIADSGYALPIIVGVFFILPLIFALFSGRVFCAAVCPLGAIQDIVLLKSVKVPRGLASFLGLIPWVYLGAAVLYAATGSAFIICRYDPFVSFFRLSGSLPMLIFSGVMLLSAVFVGRVYCRFLCPYGAIIRLLSPLAKWRVTITPDECVQCRLCEDACPFGEIRHPSPQQNVIRRSEGKKRLGILLMLLPVLIAVGAGLGYIGSGKLSELNGTVRLARSVYMEEHGGKRNLTKETEAFWKHGQPSPELYRDALSIGKKFGLGAPIFGGWIGLVLGINLIGLSVRRQRIDYEADAAGCFACGRCYMSCPVERARRGDSSAKKLLEETE